MTQALYRTARGGPTFVAMVFASVVLAQAPVQKAKVLVSDGTVSLLTEIPGGDSLLRNSQVARQIPPSTLTCSGSLSITPETAPRPETRRLRLP
jgi:hypothetical protein